MLNPRLKNLCLIPFLLVCGEVVNIVAKYDRRFLYLILLKRYHHLHQMTKSEVECVE
jgi:hypothetical protein